MFISKESFVRTGHFSSFSFFLPITPVHMFTPKPFQICTHSCRLTGSSCSEVSLLFWLRILHSCDSCTLQGSMKSSERAASSPNFPWIRSWHFNEGKDNVWNSASPGSLPSPCHRTSTSCPPFHTALHTFQTTKQTDPWILSMLVGVMAARMFSQPLAPNGSRLCRESFLLLLFCFVFIFMNGSGRKCRRKHNTTAIHKKGKETSCGLEIFEMPNCKSLIFLEVSPGL